MRNPNSVERQFAEFHRLFVADFKQDLPLYLDLAAKYPGPVLEVGCGTARVAARLAKDGHEVHAIDTSRAMLEVARLHVRPWANKVRVMDFDLRARALTERYPVVIASLFAFNRLIELEEQRVFLRHLQRSMATPGVLVLDLFCPQAMARPGEAGVWKDIDREADGQRIRVSDMREMLTPLLERRTQRFQVDEGPVEERVSHRRYVPPEQAASLLEESGFEKVRWMHSYDPGTAVNARGEASPEGNFQVIASF